ncbi:9-cis-epoxycarotenoid dioxygenase NCED6, chloroplastic, partial [Tanacetum coccineum]
KCPLIAHPKVDPLTGELFSLSYDVVKKPYLKFFSFEKNGHKSRDVSISLDQPTMIHEFAITQRHVIIPDHQVVFKLSEMVRDKSPMVLDLNKVSRYGVLSKSAIDGSSIQWIDVPDCFCFHLWNAWEEDDIKGDKIIVVIGSCMTPLDAIFNKNEDENDPLRSELIEIRLNMITGKSTRRVIVSRMNLDAGTINKRLLGCKTCYVYLAIAEPWPKCRNGEKEDERYIISYARDDDKDRSELVIVDALSMKQTSAVKLPCRVPYGFHGTFAPSTTKHSVPNVVLWNSTSFEEDDDGTKMTSSLSLKPNLSLKMGKEDGKGRFTDMILVWGNSGPLTRNNKVESTVDSKGSTYQYEQVNQAYEDRSRSNIDESRDIDTDLVAKLSSDATLQGCPKSFSKPLIFNDENVPTLHHFISQAQAQGTPALTNNIRILEHLDLYLQLLP